MVKLDAAHNGPSLIRARRLDKTYRRPGEEIHVLQGLSLDVLRGERVAFPRRRPIGRRDDAQPRPPQRARLEPSEHERLAMEQRMGVAGREDGQARREVFGNTTYEADLSPRERGEAVSAFVEQSPRVQARPEW